MTLEKRISAFEELGIQFRNKLAYGSIMPVIEAACLANSWFTEENVKYALEAVCSEMLDGGKLRQWISRYNISDRNTAKNIGIVMAGNIPLVGFFDLLCVLVTGNSACIKTSSKDRVLMEFMIESLLEIEPGFNIKVMGSGFQMPYAIIATGGDQANLHFRAAFEGIPSVLRTNRTSIAVLDGRESDEDLQNLWNDIFLYFGLGCRNVSRIFVPQGYDLKCLAGILGRKKIALRSFLNEYLQNKALLTMQGEYFIDGGFFTMTHEDGGAAKLSNISVSEYSDINNVREWLADNENRLQCVVSSNSDVFPRQVGFGRSQRPSLSDYPDGIDVISFLVSL